MHAQLFRLPQARKFSFSDTEHVWDIIRIHQQPRINARQVSGLPIQGSLDLTVAQELL